MKQIQAVQRHALILVASVWLIMLSTSVLAGDPHDEALTAAAGESICEAVVAADLSETADAPVQITAADKVKAVGSIPTYCQVSGYVASSVGFEVGLPTPWNGKLIEVGCGGHCGAPPEAYFSGACGAHLRKGYACLVSDMGHRGTGGDGLWAVDNLQARIDWGYRATHVVAVAGKAIVERFYQRPPTRAYYIGCSTGGRQGLQEAQRFPWDFDGIVAGAPPIDLSLLYLTWAWEMQNASDRSGKSIFTSDDLKLVSGAAISQCDSSDGVRDGIIGDPLHCRFDPARLLCRSAETSACLTSKQVEALKRAYSGPVDSHDTKLSVGGLVPGSESNNPYLGVETPPGVAELLTSGLRYLFFDPPLGPKWQISNLEFDRDRKRVGVMESLYDSSNPDLRRFKSAGGKMIIYQGLNDLIARQSVDYYEMVERTMGGREATQDFLRLFVLPGVGHCRGGAGADTVDYLSYLENWVEQGKAPDRLVAAHLKQFDWEHPPTFPLDVSNVAFTRPVYPYPVKAAYAGRGDPNDAGNFRPMH